jgi:hypothetical protein
MFGNTMGLFNCINGNIQNILTKFFTDSILFPILVWLIIRYSIQIFKTTC